MNKKGLSDYVSQCNTFLPDLFSDQEVIDGMIGTRYALKKMQVTYYKLLAFLVEISELANEVRCFKYWSKKPPSPKAVVLEEYVDALHFLLSIGNDLKSGRQLNYDANVKISFTKQNNDLTTLFLTLYHDATTLANLLMNSKKDAIIDKKIVFKKYNLLFIQFLKLASLINYSPAELKIAYKKKNAINQKRLYNNY